MLISGVFEIPANIDAGATLAGVTETAGLWANTEEPTTPGGGLLSMFFSSDWEGGGGTMVAPGGGNWAGGGRDIWKAWGPVFDQGLAKAFAGGMTG